MLRAHTSAHQTDLIKMGLDNFLVGGVIPGVLPTVDFGCGAKVEEAFASQRRFEPRSPLVNSEYYPGWLDHWQEMMFRDNL